MPFQKGYKHSEEWKSMMSKKAKERNFGQWMNGKHHTKETKEKMSKGKKGIAPKNIKQIAGWNKGIKHTEEHKLNLKKGWIKRKEKGLGTSPNKGNKYSEETRRKIGLAQIGRKVAEETRQKHREFRVKQVFPIKDTSIEIKIQNFLIQLNIPFLKHPYMEIEHSYLCDILIPDINLVIEIDGDYWHGNPKIFPNPNEWQLKQIEKDKIRTQELIESGFKVLRLWEHEIRKISLEEFKEKIYDRI